MELLKISSSRAAVGATTWPSQRLATPRATGSRFVDFGAPRGAAGAQYRDLCVLHCVKAKGAMVHNNRGSVDIEKCQVAKSLDGSDERGCCAQFALRGVCGKIPLSGMSRSLKVPSRPAPVVFEG